MSCARVNDAAGLRSVLSVPAKTDLHTHTHAHALVYFLSLSRSPSLHPPRIFFFSCFSLFDTLFPFLMLYSQWVYFLFFYLLTFYLFFILPLPPHRILALYIFRDLDWGGVVCVGDRVHIEEILEERMYTLSCGFEQSEFGFSQIHNLHL